MPPLSRVLPGQQRTVSDRRISAHHLDRANCRAKRTNDGRHQKAFLKGYARIFLVITPEELHTVLRDGAKKEDLC